MTTRASTSVETLKKEIFLLVARALGDDHARTPTGRYVALATRLARSDEAWLTRMIGWTARHAVLRRLRLAALAELVQARLETSATGTRHLLNLCLHRADEPGELLAYWLHWYGRALPQPVKRGVADAVVRLYDEPALATYDSPGAPLRFADVLALTHPVPQGETQTAVFRHAVARRRGDVNDIPAALPQLRARRALYWIPASRRPALFERPEIGRNLAEAAMTWATLQRWLLGTMTGPAWAAVVPSMSYQDRLAHLADFDRDGLPDESAHQVAEDLTAPASVLLSGVTPLEVYPAWRSMRGTRWSRALGLAMDLSLVNVPALPGRTLVLIDRSDLMAGPGYGGLTRAEAAAILGAALACRAARAKIVVLGTTAATLPVRPGQRPLDLIDRFPDAGGSAHPAQAIRTHAAGYDRVVVLTHPDQAAEAAEAVTGPGQEHVITDATSGWFTAIPHVEMARTADWPF
ncbi:TROVE domain-containing protein [Nonomuraea sp. K274]|uniref:TROVE domain-containing protein n=1 Tax=Nonomuraea cypriaca TaxID=1187855 RepID=A0A931AJM4_9ACTN|nr:TROVE domain-containing protein [Nonomuraea cypriaca]MBF8193811.1 TROVE domain-containing protein [Nonomuraea cypriaca]